MDWSYIAGYFDGEGHVSMHNSKRGTVVSGLSWYNTNLSSLEKMQDFMGIGHIRQCKQQSHQNKPGHVLSVTRKDDMLAAINMMLPHLLIKCDETRMLRCHLLANVDAYRMKNFGKVTSLPVGQLSVWYCDEGMSIAEIAKKLGVSHGAVCNQMKRIGMNVRRAGGSSLKGKPKSEQTRANMKLSRQKMWRDPAFRASQLAAMARPRTAFTITSGNG
jgi:hypothetical protein